MTHKEQSVFTRVEGNCVFMYTLKTSWIQHLQEFGEWLHFESVESNILNYSVNNLSDS